MLFRSAGLGYDEKTETWYIQSKVSERLVLSRQSLARLVHLYNSIHRGNTLALIEQKELHRLEEARQRHARSLRDLHLYLDRRRERSLTGRLRRALAAAARAIRATRQDTR